eukprot:m.204254 g.204254  ORF g.204254 m.204254 type:complete len:180 (+) comp22455_c0_seq1:100-639(+)
MSEGGEADLDAFTPTSDYTYPSCWDRYEKYRMCSSAALRIRHLWIYGEVGTCENEWDDLKLCFWLRQFNAKDAEMWERKLKRAETFQKPPPPSANGTVWPSRSQPPAGWAHPGSGMPDDPLEAPVEVLSPNGSSTTIVGTVNGAISSLWSNVGLVWGQATGTTQTNDTKHTSTTNTPHQ